MRASWSLVLLPVASACLPSFDDLEAACLDGGIGGAALLSADPTLLERLNCYRRYAGVFEVEVTAPVQTASEAHLAYLALADVFNPDAERFAGTRQGLLREQAGAEGFTGELPFDRVVATGAISGTDPSVIRGSVWGWYQHDPAQNAQSMIANPYVRDWAFQPQLLGIGYAVGEVSGRPGAYLDAVAVLPSGLSTQRPITWPKTGETGVPTGWRDPNAYAGEPLNKDTPWGYPITFTVSAQSIATDIDDPYGVKLTEHSLIRESDGVGIAYYVAEPAPSQPVTLRTTIMLVPEVPLDPDTAYEARVAYTTLSQPYEAIVRFTTGPEQVIE